MPPDEVEKEKSRQGVARDGGSEDAVGEERQIHRLEGDIRERKKRGGVERERKGKGSKSKIKIKGRKERVRARGAASNTEGCSTRKSRARR